MSRRSSSSSRLRSGDNCGPYETTSAVRPVAEQTPVPSLESLLASCGALQSALRECDDATDADSSDEFKHDVDDHNGQDAGCTVVAECERTEFETNSADESLADLSQQQSIDSTAVDTALPVDVKSLMNSLRQEFRISIDELKSAQSAAAASQSAVLKTLTEIIFQSSSMRDSSGGGLEQKLSEAEDRILSRINQVGGLAHVGDTKVSAASTNAGSSQSAPMKNPTARSWAEIRDEFMVNGGVYDSPVEPVLQQLDRIKEESASPEAVSAELECRLEVPRAVDAEMLNEQELRTAFYEREAFILTLIGRLRHQHQGSSGHLPAEQLKSVAEHLPEDLAVQVLQTLQQLDELARIGELELSLERARLSRQVSQLNHSRQLIEHNARQLGLTLAADGTLSNPQKQAVRGSESRRWLSKLGFGQ
ncbi:MAG: hypothetical protein WKF77_15590 [Planctomycetaceae bacterium]